MESFAERPAKPLDAMRILYKKCSKCKKEKLIRCFRKDKQKIDGLYSSCGLCWKKLYHSNPNKKINNRKTDLKRKYGLTLEEYDFLNKKQGGRCAICRGVNKNGWNLSVDHNHKTGKIRKLLCSPCNFVIGCSYENIKILKLTIKYLEDNY